VPDPTHVWTEWRPQQAPHVTGRYELRVIDPETGLPDPQAFEVACGKCGGRWKGSCLSGNVRRNILQFAARHLHADPLASPKIDRPGSLRTNGDDQ
jgi:hypothetical protein